MIPRCDWWRRYKVNIKDRSEDELNRILDYLGEKTDGDNPTVLVGGWAVYAYNPYEKSTDIDLVLNAKRRWRLLSWLTSEHSYERINKQRDGWQGTWRDFEGPPEDPRPRRIYVDVAGYSESHHFEGRDERLDFELVKNHHVEGKVNGRRVKIPTRSLLLLFKIKACYDRTSRLEAGTSLDAIYDADKLVKDRSDVLAILDSGISGPDWEVGFLGEQMDKAPFLVEILTAIPGDESALARYGGGQLSRDEATSRIDELLGLIT